MREVRGQLGDGQADGNTHTGVPPTQFFRGCTEEDAGHTAGSDTLRPEEPQMRIQIQLLLQ